MRTAILGNAGSGKSSLARSIATAAQVPVLDLDTIYWERDGVAAPRPTAAMLADLREFCIAGPAWIVEGCYGDLVALTLRYEPELILIHPGREACRRNCLARPWEPAKYPSKTEQDRHLEYLLAWVDEYYERDGPMSLRGHLSLFEGYTGPKRMITQPRATCPTDEPDMPS